MGTDDEPGCHAGPVQSVTHPGLVGMILTAMVQEDEQGLGNWHAEWQSSLLFLAFAPVLWAKSTETFR